MCNKTKNNRKWNRVTPWIVSTTQYRGWCLLRVLQLGSPWTWRVHTDGSRWVCVCCIESVQDSAAENCGPFLVKRARAHHHTILFYLCVVLGPSNKSTSHTLGNTEPSLPSALSTRRNWKMENLSLGNDAFHSIGPHALLYQAYSQSIKVPQTNLMINCWSDQSKYQCTI